MVSMETPFLKQDIVTETVRGWIIDGKYLPGQKLPTDAELSAVFQVNKCTIAAGLNRLVEENLLDRAPRRGSIVKNRNTLPTTNGVALVLPHKGEVYSPLAQSVGKCLGENNLFPILLDDNFANDHDEIISFLNRMTSQSLPYGYMCVGGSFFPYEVFQKNPKRYRNTVFLLYHCQNEVIPDCRYALIDYEDLGAQVVRYFAERNIKRILFPAHHELDFSNRSQSLQVVIMESIKQHAAEAGLEFDEGLFWRTHYGVPCNVLLPEVVKAKDISSGIFTYSDAYMTEHVLPLLENDEVMRNRELCLLGNFNTKHAGKYGFDSFDMRVADIARAGVEMLTGKCTEKQVKFSAKLVVNSSKNI